MNKKLLDKNWFSFYLADENENSKSQIIFGQPNKKYYKDKINWHNVTEASYWQLDMEDIYLNNESLNLCNGPCKLVIDTGTSIITGPTDDLRNLLPKIPIKNCEEIDHLPELGFKIDNILYTLKPEEYILFPNKKNVKKQNQNKINNFNNFNTKNNNGNDKKIEINLPPLTEAYLKEKKIEGLINSEKNLYKKEIEVEKNIESVKFNSENKTPLNISLLEITSEVKASNSVTLVKFKQNYDTLFDTDWDSEDIISNLNEIPENKNIEVENNNSFLIEKSNTEKNQVLRNSFGKPKQNFLKSNSEKNSFLIFYK